MLVNVRIFSILVCFFYLPYSSKAISAHSESSNHSDKNISVASQGSSQPTKFQENASNPEQLVVLQEIDDISHAAKLFIKLTEVLKVMNNRGYIYNEAASNTDVLGLISVSDLVNLTSAFESKVNRIDMDYFFNTLIDPFFVNRFKELFITDYLYRNTSKKYYFPYFGFAANFHSSITDLYFHEQNLERFIRDSVMPYRTWLKEEKQKSEQEINSTIASQHRNFSLVGQVPRSHVCIFIFCYPKRNDNALLLPAYQEGAIRLPVYLRAASYSDDFRVKHRVHFYAAIDTYRKIHLPRIMQFSSRKRKQRF